MGVEFPRWRSPVCACLGAAALLQHLSCAPMVTTRRVDILERHSLPPSPSSVGTTPSFQASIELHGSETIVRIEPNQVCEPGRTERQTVREIVTKEPKLRVAGTLMLVGAGVVTSALVYGQACRRNNPETGRDESCLSVLELPVLTAGAGLFVAGVTMAGMSWAKRGESSRTFQRTVETPPRASACSTPSAVGRMVELDFDSGLMLGARTNESGIASIAIPDRAWADGADTLTCRVLVDGAVVRNAVLRRASPASLQQPDR